MPGLWGALCDQHGGSCQWLPEELKGALFTVCSSPLFLTGRSEATGSRAGAASSSWTGTLTERRQKNVLIFFCLFASNKTMIETLGITLLKRGPTEYPQPRPSPTMVIRYLYSIIRKVAGADRPVEKFKSFHSGPAVSSDQSPC